eukprot:Gregarina_sp_Poly_1__585@NODE_1139_length_4971_cov_35_431688_g785_i0_p1_GENE_NODE_1139_length_4971_cov_35_431688_g785_i0NODE_1139_length_4971_cov_35_431688_g785_i0_p1_ORF_typecomplete_len615_score73_93_NODE_1139_length_4971_cov_35_431688_g785_i02622106
MCMCGPSFFRRFEISDIRGVTFILSKFKNLSQQGPSQITLHSLRQRAGSKTERSDALSSRTPVTKNIPANSDAEFPQDTESPQLSEATSFKQSTLEQPTIEQSNASDQTIETELTSRIQPEHCSPPKAPTFTGLTSLEQKPTSKAQTALSRSSTRRRKSDLATKRDGGKPLDTLPKFFSQMSSQSVKAKSVPKQSSLQSCQPRLETLFNMSRKRQAHQTIIIDSDTEDEIQQKRRKKEAPPEEQHGARNPLATTISDDFKQCPPDTDASSQMHSDTKSTGEQQIGAGQFRAETSTQLTSDQFTAKTSTQMSAKTKEGQSSNEATANSDVESIESVEGPIVIESQTPHQKWRRSAQSSTPIASTTEAYFPKSQSASESGLEYIWNPRLPLEVKTKSEGNDVLCQSTPEYKKENESAAKQQKISDNGELQKTRTRARGSLVPKAASAQETKKAQSVVAVSLVQNVKAPTSERRERTSSSIAVERKMQPRQTAVRVATLRQACLVSNADQNRGSNPENRGSGGEATSLAQDPQKSVTPNLANRFAHDDHGNGEVCEWCVCQMIEYGWHRDTLVFGRGLELAAELNPEIFLQRFACNRRLLYDIRKGLRTFSDAKPSS